MGAPPFYDCFAYANKGVKEVKRMILAQVGRSAVNKRPLMVDRPTCNATLSLTLRFIKTDDRPLYFRR